MALWGASRAWGARAACGGKGAAGEAGGRSFASISHVFREVTWAPLAEEGGRGRHPEILFSGPGPGRRGQQCPKDMQDVLEAPGAWVRPGLVQVAHGPPRSLTNLSTSSSEPCSAMRDAKSPKAAGAERTLGQSRLTPHTHFDHHISLFRPLNTGLKSRKRRRPGQRTGGKGLGFHTHLPRSQFGGSGCQRGKTSVED